MDRSWLPSALQSVSRSISPDQKRRPRWQTPSPIRAKMVPPPIVDSVYAPRSRSSGSAIAPSPAQTQESYFVRKQKQLESNLQILLDAQAEALLLGMNEGSADDGNISTGSSTPTAQSLSSKSRDHNSVRHQRKPDLLTARRGLYTTIRKLALLKQEEAHGWDEQLEECNNSVGQLENWEKKRTVLEERTRTIQSGPEREKAEELRHEADRIQVEIDDMEARLVEMRRIQRGLRRDAEEVENSVQAKLSTYTRNMEAVERDVNKFLSETRRPDWRGDNNDKEDPRSAFWSTPSKQRRLSAAKAAWVDEQQALRSKKERIESDMEALIDGAHVWKEVVNEVTTFERKLREDMAALSRPDTGDRVDRRGDAEANMRGALSQMQLTIQSLESKYTLAEARSWKLLIAAIGAELDAFRKGKQVLEATLAATQEPVSGLFDQDDEQTEEPIISSVIRAQDETTDNSQDHGQEIRDLDTAFEGKHHSNGVSDTDTEDDGPDPNLLISHQDTDTE